MLSWFVLPLCAFPVIFSVMNDRVSAEPVAVVIDSYGDPSMFMRSKRTPIGIYPPRAMMFTGYYRPIRRSNNGDQATAVFAQGNSVNGGAYFGDGYQPNYLNSGPEPANEPEIASPGATASSQPKETLNQEAQGHRDQVHGFENQDQDHNQDHPDEDSHLYTTTSPEESTSPQTERAAVPSKKNGPKKGKKIPRPVEQEEEEEEDDDDDEEYDDDTNEGIVPFVPVKGKRRQQYPNQNVFFPMIFGYPGASSRAGSSGSFPGSVTAIANSYSTGKGGAANSVATVYGGHPQKKTKRPPIAED